MLHHQSSEHLSSCLVLILIFHFPSGYESPLQKEAPEAVWISTWVSHILRSACCPQADLSIETLPGRSAELYLV